MIMNNQPEKDVDVHSTGFIGSTRQTGDPGKGKQVSLLINHGYYFLQYVFIMVEDTGFRLVVIHQGNVLTYRLYDSLRAARTAFARLYNRKSWQKGVKANWSQLYSPGQEWFDEKLALIKKYRSIC